MSFSDQTRVRESSGRKAVSGVLWVASLFLLMAGMGKAFEGSFIAVYIFAFLLVMSIHIGLAFVVAHFAETAGRSWWAFFGFSILLGSVLTGLIVATFRIQTPNELNSPK